MRSIRYQLIAEDLRNQLAAGLANSQEPASARLLPSEAELSAQYKASRVTIRRALEMLRAEGLIESKQGFGWLTAAEPLQQKLAHLGTLESQLAAAGMRSDRKILSFGFVSAPEHVAAVLGEANLLEVRRLNLADGQAFARVTVWCPEALGASLSRDDVERASFLEQLPVRLGGATQTIGAELVTALDADLLGVPVGSPVLVAERITRSKEGVPVLMSEHVFPAHRTRFTVELEVELAEDGGSLNPAGMRLLD
ncbi:MAG: GntR family transcriptional regulator [Microthrixaceae bacterium]